MRAYPAYTAEAVLAMPWRRFIALLEEAHEHQRRQSDRRFFRSPALNQEWEENREEWLRLQPPPPGRGGAAGGRS